jgi:hypothetical protein
MKRMSAWLLVAFLMQSFLAAELWSQTEFTLVKRPVVNLRAGSTGGAANALADVDSASEVVAAKKRPWIAALEILAPINVGVWAVDRYIYKRDYARISWSSWKRNLRSEWIWCPDPLSASFFGHPYHGSQFFNTARSLGLSFWESMPYAAGGYLMWGYFFENDPPSINDQIMTTLGGIQLGEIEFRLSSLVLDDTASGGERTWREIVAFLIDPIRGFNRLIGASTTSPADSELREPLHGTLSFAGKLVSEAPGLSGLRFGSGLDFDLTYGIGDGEISSRRPFDLILMNGGVRWGPHQSHLDVETGALWFGKDFGGEGGPRHVLGIFQFYNYDNNEIVRFGGMSVTGGLVSLFPMRGGAELKTSVQLGGLLLGGATNPYVLVEQRNYNYGSGLAAKVQAWLSHSRLGSIMLRLSHFQSFTIEASATSEADESHDFVTFLDASYTFPLSKSLGIRFDYGRCASRQHFEGHPSASADLSKIGGALEVRF